MTLILRSDAFSTYNLGDRSGYTGPLDFKAMLDFSSGEYYRLVSGARVDMSLSDAVTVTRSSTGVVMRRDGSYATVAANTPRLSYDKDHDISGLLIDSGYTNRAASATNGSAVSISGGGTNTYVILSFKGGDASLSSASLTQVDTYVASGRTVKVYSRSSSAVISATLANSGASDIQVLDNRAVSNGLIAGLFLGYSGSMAIDTAVLGPTINALAASGDFSVIQQVVLQKTGATDGRAALSAIAVKSGSPQGGAYLKFGPTKSGSGMTLFATAVDGSGANSATNHFNVTGAWSDRVTMGLCVSGHGNQVSGCAWGKSASGTGYGARFGAPATIHIGGETGMDTQRIGGLITRVVVYDRMLTSDELAKVAQAWP